METGWGGNFNNKPIYTPKHITCKKNKKKEGVGRLKSKTSQAPRGLPCFNAVKAYPKLAASEEGNDETQRCKMQMGAKHKLGAPAQCQQC